MIIYCFNCHKPVSSFLPDNTVFAATALCAECAGKPSAIEEELRKYIYVLEMNTDMAEVFHAYLDKEENLKELRKKLDIK